MAWSASKVFAFTILNGGLKDTYDVDWDVDVLLVALYNNTITPDNTVTTLATASYNGAASQWLTANEVYQAGQWVQGGVGLGTTTGTTNGSSTQAVAQNYNSQGNNVVALSAASTSSGAAATLASVYGCLVYDSTTSSIGLCYNYFGGTNSVTGGTFTVVWNANGIATFTC